MCAPIEIAASTPKSDTPNVGILLIVMPERVQANTHMPLAAHQADVLNSSAKHTTNRIILYRNGKR